MKPETSINYKKIVDDVLEKISRGELQKGDKLPTELCLATRFEVSRTCVREAIKSLEAMGIVQSIQGSGSYITNTPEQSINRPLCALFALSNGTLENVLDLRNVLETDVCRDIIRTATDDEIARLCALGENIENESAPVHDAHAELFLDRPRLRGRELVVDHNEITLVVRYDLLYFLQFARAEKAARVGRLAGLQDHGDRVRARGIHERGKLLHRNFGGALLGVHARCGKPREHRPFSFLRQVLNG